MSARVVRPHGGVIPCAVGLRQEGGDVTREEALRILGLDESATDEEIKAAYKECVQILHPDRFASNEKLAERATEQFKNLQEAYDCLMDPRKKGASSRPKAEKARPASSYSTAEDIEARIAGITAARVQLVAERDALLGQRRNGGIILLVGLVVAAVFRRSPMAIGLGSTAIVWGVVQTLSAQKNVGSLNAQLEALAKEKRELLERLDSL